jgi:membrane-associated phospholipid phosphatase
MPMRERAVNVFLVGWAMVVLPAAIAVFGMDRFALHLRLNSWHTPAGDVVLRLVTHLADTPVPIALSFLLLLHSWRAFLLMGLGNGLAALLVQAIKHGPAAHMLRPTMHLDEMAGLPLVPGVDQLLHHSFPSGHAAAAFGSALALSVLVGRPRPALLFVLLAVTIGFSRIYLSQHFAEDVLAGAIIGTLLTWAVYRLLYRMPFAGRPWLERSPLRAQNQ